MSEFGGFLRESLALGLRRQFKDLEQRADPREVVKIGSLHAENYYSHALTVSVLPGWVVLDFFDTDRDEPLRPQTFAVSREEWVKIHAAARGASSAFALGTIRKVTAISGSLETEDAYGSHFSVTLDDGFEPLWQNANKELQKTPPQNRAQELQEALDRLAGGQWPRSHPVVMAVQDRFETSQESAQALAPYLHSDNCAVLLFACALLHEELKDQDSELLIEPLLKVVEQGKSSEQEAAEGHLSYLPKLPTQALQRLAKQIPLRGGDPYSTGSLLRPFLVAKDGAAAPAVKPLAKVFPTLLERAQASRRLEFATVVDQALRIFASAPDQWADSRGAVEYALQAQWRSAEDCKKTLLQTMPCPWDRGLVVPSRPQAPPAPTAPRATSVSVRGAAPRVDVRLGDALGSAPAKSNSLKNLSAAVSLCLLMSFIYWLITVSEPPKARSEPKPSAKAAQSKPRGYQLGPTTIVATRDVPQYKIDGEPVEGVEDRWARYRTPEGDTILSGYTRFSGRSHRPTFAQSDVLMLNGKAVLKAGQPIAAWKEHKQAAEAAGIHVQREVVKDKTTILGFAPKPVEDSADWAPHTSASVGSGELLGLMADRDSTAPQWKASLAKYPDWKRLRLSDGSPLVHRLATQPNRRIARRDAIDKARFLIENGYDLSLKDAEGRSALHLAGNADLLKLLLKKGLGVEQADIYGRTPIYGASGVRLEMLLAANADPNHQDSSGKTPLMLAPDAEAVFALLQAGALADAKDESGRNALFYQRGLESLILLLEAGANPETRDSGGQKAEETKSDRDLKNYRLALSKARQRS